MDITCPICGAQNSSLIENDGEYDMRNCDVCGGGFADPMKGGSGEFYEKSYGATGGGYGEKKWEFSEFLSDAKKLGITGKLLEIGSGPGWFLKEAQEAGFESYGIDFNQAAVEHAKRLGINAKFHDLEKVKTAFPGILFDAVVLFHVLEHLENPTYSIGQFKDVLRQGGILVIATPNAERTVLKLNPRARQEGWDYPPHHLTRWNKKSLTKFLEKNGFEIILIKEERAKTIKETFKFVRSLMSLVTSTGVVVRAERNAAAKSIVADKKLSLLLSLAQVKNMAIYLISLIFAVPFYLIAKAYYIKGVNLYCIVRKSS